MKNKQKYNSRLKPYKNQLTKTADEFFARSMNKGIYFFPNLITSLSLFSGFYSIINSINGKFYIAGWLIVVSIFLDGLDGKVARITNTSSKFGIEYDSLSDLIAFGAAPSILVYVWQLKNFGKIGWALIFVYFIGAALRLARFNVQVNSVENKKFTGLPSPAAAGMAVFSIFAMKNFKLAINYHIVMMIAMPLLGLLMISNISYYAMKDLSIFKKKPFEILALASLIIIIIIIKPVLMFFLIFIVYCFISPLLYFYLNNDKIKIKNIKK
ncbi:MAG: CDP-diacylglycerol--serine O-phosphatidyltransferase [Deltaproteobacteria bacterium]|nr:CDP-diacylglycerol--serine O-phosphatidyltransferase [Deltaproteobacteria bacterium]